MAGSGMVDITLPAEQSEGTEIVISLWFKAVGDAVTENEPLLEVSTDKVNVEIAAPASGRLAEILKDDGERVEPGELVGRIALDAPGAQRQTAPAKPPTEPESLPQADGASKTPPVGARAVPDASSDLSPAVRRLLKEHNLDASTIAGTGRGGRITHQDVVNAIEAGTAASPVGGTAKGAPAAGTPAASGPVASTGKRTSAIPSRSVPHTQMRRSIAQHMVQSMSVAPHVTSVFDADLSAVVAHREANKVDFESRGAKLTYTAYFVAAAVEALKAVPEANARWHDDRLEIFEDINVGVATALPKGGLIVPVITKAQDLDLFGIAERLGDLSGRARGGSLDPKDVQSGTFTISNHGVSGSLVAAPIVINQPQVAILGVGKLERRVVVDEMNGKEEMVIKPMCYVTLTIDHRVLDGFQANQFLTKFVDALETV
ncbi:MAG: 2-oxo acid dehydrogenase subunit E2 [Gemmatimonadota bacterium]|nr:2-oxo acid dehydrogenase subunit E2 [Gemmatimonadota bacterium]